MNSGVIESLLNEREVAKILNLSLGKVRHLRIYGGGPSFVKLGDKTVRYRQQDVREFISSITPQKITKKREPITVSEIFNKETE
jgi:predicted DNA-binding transcriptional regulator AlpA